MSSGALDIRDDDGQWHGVKQVVPVEPYATYRISMIAKTGNGDAYFGFRASGYGVILGERQIGRNLTAWTPRSVDVNVGNRTSVDLYVGVWAGQGNMTFVSADDVTLTKLPRPPLASNGDFATGALAPWLLTQSTGAGITVADGILDIRSSGGQWLGIKQAIAVEPNATYRISVLARTGAADGYFGLREFGWGPIISERQIGRNLGEWTARSFDVNVGNRTSVDLYVGLARSSPQ